MTVLLVWPSDGMRLFESMMPLGLASLGAMLEQKGFMVRIIDFNHFKGSFKEELRSLHPILVGVGGTTATRQASFQIAKTTKEVLPECPIVYGGPHATFAYEDTLNHVPAIDYVLRGEAEYSLLALCQALQCGEFHTISSIPGIALRTDGKVITRAPERIQDLSQIPPPARHLLGRKYPMTLDHTDIPADFIVTSRGCPVICDFCAASRLFPGGVRLRPMELVRAEIGTILRTQPHVGGLKVFDSTFTANRNHVLAFCDLMESLQLKWECEVRVDTVDHALLERMRNAGCVFVSIGFETTDPEQLKRMGKRITPEQVDQVLDWCHGLGIITKVFFTFGHFGQTYQDCLKDLAYLRTQRKRIQFYATTIGIRVYPGTILESRLRKSGHIPASFSWATYKASRKNWLVLEPADVMILDQDTLPLHRLGFLILRLVFQGTVLSPNYILKMLRTNLKSFFRLA
jgi:anaerobic magnesium-protoporphyrin IX monomethyl ester cyclase